MAKVEMVELQDAAETRFAQRHVLFKVVSLNTVKHPGSLLKEIYFSRIKLKIFGVLRRNQRNDLKQLSAIVKPVMVFEVVDVCIQIFYYLTHLFKLLYRFQCLLVPNQRQSGNVLS